MDSEQNLNLFLFSRWSWPAGALHGPLELCGYIRLDFQNKTGGKKKVLNKIKVLPLPDEYVTFKHQEPKSRTVTARRFESAEHGTGSVVSVTHRP